MEQKAREMFNVVREQGGLTEREIATRVGLRKTPYTRSILFSLIEFGHIFRFWDSDRKPAAYTFFAQETQALEMQ